MNMYGSDSPALIAARVGVPDLSMACRTPFGLARPRPIAIHTTRALYSFRLCRALFYTRNSSFLVDFVCSVTNTLIANSCCLSLLTCSMLRQSAPIPNNHAHRPATRNLQVLIVQTPPEPLQCAVRPQSPISRATVALVRVIASLDTRVGLIHTTDGPGRPAKGTCDVARDHREAAMRTDGYAWMTTRHVKVDSDAHFAVKPSKAIGRVKSIPDSNSLTNISSSG